MPKLKITIDDNTFLLLPQKLTGELLAGADALYVKLYLAALELASRNAGHTCVRDICIAMGEGEEAVVRAMSYWAGYGLVRYLPEDGSIRFAPADAPAQTTPAPAARPPVREADTPPVYLPGEVAASIEQSRELGQMFALAQTILGRTLSSAAAATLYSFYDWLGLPLEVILMLLEHCAEMGKRDMRYIEKVAISWHQMGIDSVDAAEAYLKTQTKKNRYCYRVKKVLGIEGRSFTPSEQRFLDAWYERLKASPELIGAAFDHCVAQTGKLSFAYMNKVLTSWHEAGIHTPAQAQRALADYSAARVRKPAGPPKRAGKKDLEVYGSGRYDYSQIEAAALGRLKSKMREDT